MARILALRISQGMVVILLVATLTYALLQLAPGDPFSALLDSSGVPPAFREQQLRLHGLDRPILEQYGAYLAGLLRGDLGTSFAQNRPVLAMVLDHLPNTALLAAAALLVDFALGIGIGVVQGSRPGSVRDDLLSAATLTLYATPVFWLGLMLVLLLAQPIEWLPTGGARDPVLYGSLSLAERVGDRLRHLLLPALTLGLVGAASTARYQRTAMQETIRQDFIRTARASGIRERAVLWRHALRNALLPTITLFGMSLPVVLSGSVLVESVFSWPGIGRLAVESIRTRDYPVVTGIAMFTAVVVVLGNLLADLAYHAVDPRTRESA